MVSDALVSLHIFFDPVLADLIPTVVSVVVREGPGERGAQWTEFVSWEPRAFVYHNFLVITAAAAHSAFPSTPIITAAAAMVHSVLHLLTHAHCPVFVGSWFC